MYCHMPMTGTDLATCSEQVLVLPHAPDRDWSCHMRISGSFDITYIDTMPTIDNTFFLIIHRQRFGQKKRDTC